MEDKKLYSAKEAYQISNSIKNQAANEQLQEIDEAIQHAAKEGNYKCYYYKNILPAVNLYLEEAGYAINSTNTRNEYIVTISWAHIND